MTKYCPTETTLFEVPDFDLAVVRDTGHVVTVGVEGDAVDGLGVGVVVLDEFAEAGVPELDCAVEGGCGDACAVGCELAAQYF